jgi:hypothetical protein
MGKEGEGILVYYCIPQRDRVADVHAWPQGDLLRTEDLRQETCGNDVTRFAMAIDCQAQL